eukprot:403368762
MMLTKQNEDLTPQLDQEDLQNINNHDYKSVIPRLILSPLQNINQIYSSQTSRGPSHHNSKKFDKEFNLDFFRLNRRETENVTKLLVKNLSGHLIIGNKKRLRSLQDKLHAEELAKSKSQSRNNLFSRQSGPHKSIQDLQLKTVVADVPITQEWKRESYQHFKLPLNDFLERERQKKEVKSYHMPMEVSNYIEACLKDKEISHKQQIYENYRESIMSQGHKTHRLQPLNHDKSSHILLNENHNYLSRVQTQDSLIKKPTFKASASRLMLSNYNRQHKNTINEDISETLNTQLSQQTTQSNFYKNHYQSSLSPQTNDYNSTFNQTHQNSIQSQQQNNLAIPTKLFRKYKQIFDRQKPDVGMTRVGQTNKQQQLDVKTSRVINIIQECDDLKDEFQVEKEGLQEIIDINYEDCQKSHQQLKKYIKSKKLLVINPSNKHQFKEIFNDSHNMIQETRQ